MPRTFTFRSTGFVPLVGGLVLFALFLTGCATSYTQLASAPPADEPEPQAEPSGGEFHQLVAYGDWIFIEPFGAVWSPSVVSGWHPYQHGHWVWTNFGWTWVSYEPFGWAVYHYGYWHYDVVWGWVWLPAYEWYPCRVDWYIYGDYVCWSPLAPPGYEYGDPWSVHRSGIWNVVHSKDFMQSDVGRFTVRSLRPRSSTAKVRRKAPTVEYLERRTRATIRPVDVEMKKVTVGRQEFKRMKLPPSQRKKVERYRPGVERDVMTPQTPKKTGTMTKPKERKGTRPKTEKKKKKQ